MATHQACSISHLPTRIEKNPVTIIETDMSHRQTHLF